jgi:hypothetical protein
MLAKIYFLMKKVMPKCWLTFVPSVFLIESLV